MRSFVLSLCLLLCLTTSALAVDSFEVNSSNADIDGSIKYSILGRYKAKFDSFNGKIVFDQKSMMVQSVDLSIDVASIRSNCSWCDRIVCSSRLMHVTKYPTITFKSHKITRDKDGYLVTGELIMHGVKKVMTLPFRVNETTIDGRRFVDFKGRWVIDRKIFGVRWHSFLDKGGVPVGDHITVDWSIRKPL